MKYLLYRLEKTKILFEDCWLINPKLCHLNFNNPKFHVINHFVLCICDYGSTVNHDLAHSNTPNKFLLKAFYNMINKHKYNLEIQWHNIPHTNIIAIKNLILLVKNQKKKECI